MEDEFQCPICMEVCEDAMETGCCHRIFCQRCLEQVDSCPSCRAKPLSRHVAHFARRIIGNMNVDCPLGCGRSVPRSELAAHGKSCPNKKYKCPAPGCCYEGDQDGLAHHLAADHKEILVSKAEHLFTKPVEVCVGQLVDVEVPAQETGDEFDRIRGKTNERRCTARLGENGKFYCGRALNSRCSCCNGNCGPTDGCNCGACMKLDVWRYRLTAGWLVNREGMPSHLSSVTGKFYCGRKMPQLALERYCDGFCGPTNGPNCFACQKLDEQKQSRYGTAQR